MFQLKVQRIQQTCLFELSWGRGQQLSTLLNYPEALTQCYQDWQRIYLSFYNSALRGRVAESGSIAAPPIDWHAKLVQAEAKLLYEFHRWLRSAELFEIRATIARAAGQGAERGDGYVDVFLCCSPLELARFPWEAWELGTEFASTGKIRIARSPANIRSKTISSRSRQGKARILAILGDDTGLNFQVDQQAVQALSPIAEVKFIGWQPGQGIPQLKDEICAAIADEQGWDGLFFAGHSNETEITGGELAIAPGAFMSISEISRYLSIAKDRGLQFAIFNSCWGLNIAEALIDLGLSQVAVMREPIHNDVAQTFLVRFLQALAEHQDVHDALLAASRYLKLEKNLTYPSAYLIPSLFCHPDSTLFRIEPFGWKQRLQRWLPNRQEAIALGALACLSLWPAAGSSLMEWRTWTQAVYRDATNQVPATPAPVVLVQIDEKSIRKAGISSPNPLDREYLATLIDRLSALNAKTVGVDYLLDRQQPGKDPILGKAVREAVARKPSGTWFVFGSIRGTAEGEIGVGAETGIASQDWSLQGYTNTPLWYVRALSSNASCYDSCPFAYLLAIAHLLNQPSHANSVPQPQLQSQTDFRSQILNYTRQQQTQDAHLAFLERSRLLPITSFARQFNQIWLQPILDFSIPPQQVYDSVAAWELLDPSFQDPILQQMPQKAVILAAGGYAEAGAKQLGSDNFAVPKAVAYWRSQDTSQSYGDVFMGAEGLAYMTHHWLQKRLVVPIPDLWCVAIAALLGKLVALKLQQHREHQKKYLVGLGIATVGYGVTSMQLYITAQVLLPWLLPSAAFWLYIVSDLRKRRRKPHHAST